METPLEELLAGYVLGNLSPEEENIVREYINTHPEIQSELNALQNTLALVPFALPEPIPSLNWQRNPVKPLSLLWIGVTVLVTLITGFLGWRNHQMHQKLAQFQRMMESPDSKLISLKGMNQKPMGNLIISPSRPRGILVLQNLSTLPAGNQYTLWIIDKNGRKIFCTDFLPDPRGKVLVTVPLKFNLAEGHQAIITIEAEGNNIHPQGELVIRGDLI